MYVRFGAMVAVWTVIMFRLMYLNTYEVGHVFFSERDFTWPSSWGAPWQESCCSS